MKKLLLTVICLLTLISINAQESIEPYFNFLKNHTLSAKEYIFKCFETADIVVLGERDHRDTTQYNLILEVISDPRFIEKIGNVYTEVGVINKTPGANKLIKSSYDTQTEFDKEFVKHQIVETWNPQWQNFNRYQLLHGISEINDELPNDKKISIGLFDMEFDWKKTNPEKYRHFIRNEMNKSYRCRDSIMADNFICFFYFQWSYGTA